MKYFKNVDVDKLANIYYEGKVISRNIFLKGGSKKSLGVMLVGEYEFNTESRELMKIISGRLNLKLKDENEWKLITNGMEFNIPKNSSFKLSLPDIISISSLDTVLNSYSPTNITPNVFLEPSFKNIFLLITLPSK